VLLVRENQGTAEQAMAVLTGQDTPRPAPVPIATPRLRYQPAAHAAMAALPDAVVADSESREQTAAARAAVGAAQATATQPAAVGEPASHSTDTPLLGPSTAPPRPATWPPPPPRAAHGGGPDLTLLRNGPHDMTLPRTGRDCYLLSVGAHLFPRRSLAALRTWARALRDTLALGTGFLGQWQWDVAARYLKCRVVRIFMLDRERRVNGVQLSPPLPSISDRDAEYVVIRQTTQQHVDPFGTRGTWTVNDLVTIDKRLLLLFGYYY
jgi:hypothetical protein